MIFCVAVIMISSFLFLHFNIFMFLRTKKKTVIPVTQKVRKKTNALDAGITVFEIRGYDIYGVKNKKTRHSGQIRRGRRVVWGGTYVLGTYFPTVHGKYFIIYDIILPGNRVFVK